jgi:branched-chain amino acid transport system substrate-binding protein
VIVEPGLLLKEANMLSRNLVAITLAILAGVATAPGRAEDIVKVGIVMPMSGGFALAGRQVVAGVRLFMQQHGDIVGGKKVQLIVRDDASLPDLSKRIAQELIVTEKVNVLGVGLTPNALAIAPLSRDAKIATVVMISGTSSVTEASPYLVRTSFTLGQQSGIIADWAAKNGSKRAVVLHSDFGPGTEAARVFVDRFTEAGGQILEIIKVPMVNPDFAPFLQRARDLRPDTLFVFVPANGQAGTFARQFVERGLDKAGIKLIGTGDLTDDQDLAGTGDAMLGTVTAGFYSTAHPSALNMAFIEAFKNANPTITPNLLAVSGYDGMRLIYSALEKTQGSTDGDVLVGAMKGMAWESPRGPMSIDPETRDVVHNIYIRRVERIDGVLCNSEFVTFESVSDPLKAGKRASQ